MHDARFQEDAASATGGLTQPAGPFPLACLLAVVCLPACERGAPSAEQVVRAATGGGPLNQIVAFGRGPMPHNDVLSLPECDATLNGRGDYRVMVDSGAGQALILSPSVAEELGLRRIDTSSVWGIGGGAQVGLALLDELVIGEIRCKRVLTLLASEQSLLLLAFDGVLGTGVLRDGRVKLDFENAELAVSGSSDEPGVGTGLSIELGSEGHIFATVELHGVSATAMLDSGANQSVFSPRWLEKHLPEHPVVNWPLPMFGAGQRLTRPQISAGADLVFAGRRIENLAGAGMPDVDSALSRHAGRQVDLVIGMNVFREMKSWTVDYPRRRMWVDWLDDIESPQRRGSHGDSGRGKDAFGGEDRNP